MSTFTRTLFFLFSLFFFNSCSPASNQKENKVSLHKYGFPVSIKVPKDVAFTKGSSSFVESLTLVNNDGFNMQVLMTNASSGSLKKAKLLQREIVINNPDFLKIIEDYDDHFIFELELNGDRYYDFRFVKIVGNKEIVFQGGPTCNCTEENIKKMVNAVQ
ncbi:MAG: hypothetical protein WAT79_14490 [Saprospiraceae bacterium]